jgi:vancomycin permeability regulator SanA
MLEQSSRAWLKTEMLRQWTIAGESGEERHPLFSSPAFVSFCRYALPKAVTLLTLVAILASLLVVRDAVGIWSYTFRKTASVCTPQTVLVMGAAQYDGRPSPAFQRRLDKAHELYRQGCAPNILVTGGKRTGDRFTEGEAGVRYLASLGVPRNVLQSETKSVSSFENLELSRPLLASKNLTIVTDDLHAYRTHYLANKLGYKAELATVFNPYKRFTYAMRELMMLMAYHLGIIR